MTGSLRRFGGVGGRAACVLVVSALGLSASVGAVAYAADPPDADPAVAGSSTEAYANFVPAPATLTATGVGVGQPIVVQFTAPVQDEAAVQEDLQVTTTPSQPGAWYWVDNRDAHYRPQNFWSPGTTIEVHADIAGADLGDGVIGAEDHDAVYHVHDSWIAEADGAAHHMQIMHNGALVKTMAISMGKATTPTHTGTHVISEKDQNEEMNSCTYGVCKGQPGYYDVIEHWAERISQDGEFVHENPGTVAQQGSANVSHGCINLDTADAEWFFQNFGPGDVVEVSGSGGTPLPVWDLYGDWSLPWSTWQGSP
jgi:lipoprotein-anchoring transpeptidase ErfK/SrfK